MPGSSENIQITGFSESGPWRAITSGTPPEQHAATAQSIVLIFPLCFNGSVSAHSMNILESAENALSEYRIIAALLISGSNFITVRMMREIRSSAPNATGPAQRTDPSLARNPPVIAATSCPSRAPRIAKPIFPPETGISD